MNIYQAEHLENLAVTVRTLGKMADHLRTMPVNKDKASHVGLVLRFAELCVIEYTQGIAQGLDPFDSMTKAVDAATDNEGPINLQRLDLRPNPK